MLNIYEQENSPIMFETVMLPLYSEDLEGSEYLDSLGTLPLATSMVGIFNKETGQFLGSHKRDSYKMVNNIEYFDAIDNKIRSAFDPYIFEGMEIKDQASHGGARCIRQWIFPELGFTLENTNHRTAIHFRIIAENCFDGSSKCRIIYGDIDTYCSNGMITGQYDIEAQKRTSGFNLSSLVDSVQLNQSLHNRRKEKYQRWLTTLVNDETVLIYFEKLPITKKLKKDLFTTYQAESAIRGENLWSVISAMTYYASHSMNVRRTNNDHLPNTLLNRQINVAKWIDNDNFKALENKPTSYYPSPFRPSSIALPPYKG